MPPRRASVLAFAALLAAACSHPHVSFTGEPRYGRAAEDDYQYGMEELEHGKPDYAAKFFEHVRSRYPFSKYAALSELRLADVKYKLGHYNDAASAYADFVKAHPNHDEAGHAAFAAGAAHWREAPSRFFLLPPDYEKDLVEVSAAVEALERYLKDYPQGADRPEAEKVLTQARGLLLQREWYVVGYYRRHGRWPGVAARLEGILRNYPDAPRQGEALYGLAEAYLEMGERYRAQEALQELVVKHPDDPERGRAEKLLASLR